MKKIYLLIVINCMTFTTFAHTFITEILVNSNTSLNENGDMYNIVEYFSLDASDILIASEDEIHRNHDGKRLEERLKLEVLKQVMPSHSGAKIILCNDNEIIPEVGITCGQFDHFDTARKAAIKTCYILANQNPALYSGPLIPQYSGPNTFIDQGSASYDHHNIYHITDGLIFNCVEVLISNE